MTARRYKPGNTIVSPLRGLLLFVLPFPLVIAVFIALGKGGLSAVVGNALGFVLFMTGAVMTRKGFRIEREYKRRSMATTPDAHYKNLGGVMIALATGVTAYMGVGHGLLISLVFGVIALAGYYLTYGGLPWRGSAGRSSVRIASEAVVKALNQAEQTIQGIEQAGENIRNREFSERLRAITAKARRILETIEDDPKDLRRARKFLVVYLEGTRRITEGYANTHGADAGDPLEENFRRVLNSIEQVFEQQRKKLLEDDILDLDVQLEVLEAQLKQEGVI